MACFAEEYDDAAKELDDIERALPEAKERVAKARAQLDDLQAVQQLVHARLHPGVEVLDRGEDARQPVGGGHVTETLAQGQPVPVEFMDGDHVADRAALGRVGVEQGALGRSLDDVRQLPGQVEGVLHAGVHALAAGRAVDVGGVAGQEHAALAVVLHLALVDAEVKFEEEPDKPVDLAPEESCGQEHQQDKEEGNDTQPECFLVETH